MSVLFNTTSCSMHVASIDPFYRPEGDLYRVGTNVTIQDTEGSPVASARVRLTVTLPGGSVVGLKGTTDSTGNATVCLLSTSTGTYVFKVQAVILGGWDYDRSENVETWDSIVVP